MSQRFDCPSCRRALRVPAGCTDPHLTCPKCLAEIANPEATGPGATAEAVQPEPSTPAAPPGVQCPSCGQALERSWRFCPACTAAVIRGSPRSIDVASPDVDVRRDQRGTGCAVAFLAILGGLGLVSILAMSVPGVVVLVGVLGAAALAANRVYSRPHTTTGPEGFGRVVVQTLAFAGMIFGILILLAVAALIVLFVVCMTHSGHW